MFDSPRTLFSMLNYGFRSLIGPVIGGHLADPVKNLPSIFPRGTLSENFPYLLPNLIVVLFIVASGILGHFFLEKSHPNMQNQPDVGRRLSSWFGRVIRRLASKQFLGTPEQEPDSIRPLVVQPAASATPDGTRQRLPLEIVAAESQTDGIA